MNVSFEGIGQWSATFACNGEVADGQMVKVSGNGEVSACADGDDFCGMVVTVGRDGKACAVALGGMVAYMFWNKTRHPLEVTAVAFIVGGGIGNMIERLSRGFVVDFVDVKCIPHWKYIFNVADIFVCVGCGLFILYILLFEAKVQKKEESQGCGRTNSSPTTC